MGDGCFFGLLPVGSGRRSAPAGLDAPETFADPLEGRLERLRHRFASLGGPVPDFPATLECDDQLRFDAIDWVDTDRGTRGGCCSSAPPPTFGPPRPGPNACHSRTHPNMASSRHCSARVAKKNDQCWVELCRHPHNVPGGSILRRDLDQQLAFGAKAHR